MSLSAGDRVGHYQILAPLGKGGMGEVFRARDTKLEREVALKILPEALAGDPERLARFEREAKVLASLNHPNIAQIYGLEGAALVMELIPGETLQGPLPLDTALNYAEQIASALEAAHEKGITHRDLKPANVMVTPGGIVKLLDFGLAGRARQSGGDPEDSPTLTLGATQAGAILGTPAYMSPEQASGQPADRRSDIWSFGVVLLEMLTGKRAFTGETLSDVLAAVLAAQPDLSRAPAAVQPLLRSCLQKDPRKRLQAIGDWRLALPQHASPAAALQASKLAWIVAAAFALAAAAGFFEWWRATRPVEHRLIRLSADLGPDALAGPRITVAISPDGTRIAFPMRGPGGVQMLATRLLDQATPVLLPGTEGASDPFFKPDGAWIGFFADGKLKKISAGGGAAITLCDAPGPRGAAWGEDGNIVATLSNLAGVGLSRVPDAGGTPQRLTRPSDVGDSVHRWPQILPEGNAIVFTAHPSVKLFDEAKLDVLNLKTGEIKTVKRGGYFGRYLPGGGSEGHLIYVHEGVLFGVAFDPGKLETLGPPAPLLDDITADSDTGAGQLDVSETGTLVYRSGRSNSSYPVMSMDSAGRTTPLIAAPAVYFTPRFSPDGKRLAVATQTEKGIDIFVHDLERGSVTRLTFTGQRDGQTNANPVWTPDGKHIVFGSQNQNTFALWWIRPDGGGEAQLLRETKDGLLAPSSFSPDGRTLAFNAFSPETNVDLWTMPLDLTDPEHPHAGQAEKFYASPQNDFTPMFSPDGHWIAYSSTDQGPVQVYVRPFPGPGGVWQVSADGGAYPFWSPDGKKLYFMALNNRILAADYTVESGAFHPGKAYPWSDVTLRQMGGNVYNPYDVAPDGRHFAIFAQQREASQTGSVHVTFLLNFFDEVRRRAPAAK